MVTWPQQSLKVEVLVSRAIIGAPLGNIDHRFCPTSGISGTMSAMFNELRRSISLARECHSDMALLLC